MEAGRNLISFSEQFVVVWYEGGGRHCNWFKVKYKVRAIRVDLFFIKFSSYVSGRKTSWPTARLVVIMFSLFHFNRCFSLLFSASLFCLSYYYFLLSIPIAFA
jgi:hypothetical protein